MVKVEYLNELTKRKIFSRNDFSTILNDDNLVKILIQNYLEKGYIKRSYMLPPLIDVKP